MGANTLIETGTALSLDQVVDIDGISQNVSQGMPVPKQLGAFLIAVSHDALLETVPAR